MPAVGVTEPTLLGVVVTTLKLEPADVVPATADVVPTSVVATALICKVFPPVAAQGISAVK